MRKKIAIPAATLALVAGLAVAATVSGDAPWSPAPGPTTASEEKLGPDVVLPTVEDVPNPLYAGVKPGDEVPEHPGLLTEGLSAYDRGDGTYVIVSLDEKVEAVDEQVLALITEQVNAVPAATTPESMGAQAVAREAAAATALDGAGKVLVIVSARPAAGQEEEATGEGFDVWMKEGDLSRSDFATSRADVDRIVAGWTAGDGSYLVVESGSGQ